MSDLPADLLADVLSWLPAKSLLRFRCVSKPWRDLIDSPSFVKMHLRGSIERKNNLRLIVKEASDVYSIDFDSLDNVVKIDHPLKRSDWGLEVLGSCDGLICLYDSQDIVIWNPSTRKYQKLPGTEIEFTTQFTLCQYMIYGFGYDSVTDDYKLLRMVQFYGQDKDSFGSEVKVYSLKSHSWRRTQDCPYYLRHQRAHGVLVSGALHWVVSRKAEYLASDIIALFDPVRRANSNAARLIAAFDLGTEEYRLVPQPQFSNKDFHMSVGVLEGCLCIFCNFQVSFDVWVMKEYGVEESWIKLLTVSQPQVVRSFEFVIPLAYSRSGREVFLALDDNKHAWYDLERKKVNKVNIRGLPICFEIYFGLESLVPIKGGSRIDGKKQQGPKQKKMENMEKMRDDFLSKGFQLVL